MDFLKTKEKIISCLVKYIDNCSNNINQNKSLEENLIEFNNAQSVVAMHAHLTQSTDFAFSNDSENFLTANAKFKEKLKTNNYDEFRNLPIITPSTFYIKDNDATVIMMIESHDDYLNRAGNFEPIYAIKVFFEQEKKVYEMFTFFLIQSLFPRLFVNCEDREKCKSYNPVNVNCREYCMKTWRRKDDCGLEDGFESAYNVLPAIFYVMQRYHNRKYVTLLSPKNPDNTPETSQKLSGKSKNNHHVIYLIDEIHRYSNPEKRESHGGTHASPCEHIRKGHYHRLRNGKVVYFEPVVVNKGKKKGVYKVC